MECIGGGGYGIWIEEVCGGALKERQSKGRGGVGLGVQARIEKLDQDSTWG